MLVQFTPQINSASTPEATFMNFLRCIKAIATAAAGTSSLTVNPFTNNTGTIDNTRNCIVSILANTEAGGWTESASSNVVQTGSFTSGASINAYTYKFDAYVPSGKGTYPYLKFSVTSACGGSNYGDPFWEWGGVEYPLSSVYSTFYPPMFTFGYSTTTDWTDTKYPPGNGSWTSAPNSGITSGPGTKTSVSFGGNTMGASQNSNWYPQTCWQPYVSSGGPATTYWMACTANYIIIWEQNINNSYLNGYANTMTGLGPAYYRQSGSYGTLFACGFRESQAWENSYSNNPTIYAMHYHAARSWGGSTTSPYEWNGLWAPMLTINDSGVISTTLGTCMLCSSYGTEYAGRPDIWNPVTSTTTTVNSVRSLDQYAMFREIYGGNHTSQIYKPGVDNNTGIAVPAAYPIMVRRSTSGSWNNGGAIRGIYKSLSMPITTMRNYFANGQTFNIYNNTTGVTDTYLPIVFNEEMWLVRYA